MKKRLFLKFLAAYAVLALACFILISTVGSDLVQEGLETASAKTLYRETSEIAADTSELSFYKKESLESMLDTLQSLAAYQKTEIWYLNTNGEILLSTETGITLDDPYEIKKFNPSSFNSGYYSIGNFFGYFPSKTISVIYPVTSNNHVHGYIAIHNPVSNIVDQRESILLTFHKIFAIIFLLFLSILGLIYLLILRPLHTIQKGIQEYASGNLDYQVDLHSQDELGYLASRLTYMANTLANSEESQKKFISNVSHDFRSPLTSIKGYIEAIQDGTIPPEFQERYLNIILQETKRLEKLTSDLLTLNNLDSKGNYVALSNFDINDMIRNTAASFGGKCISRHISLELILDGMELYAYADFSKIQQVLYNLIDNAIKFSKDNSVIEIETELRREKIHVSVKDHGCGIPRDDIPKIWDRFYKSDSSRGRDTSGTGLGLAIVRDIINQHNQTISVVSTEGAGTEFKFTLDKSMDNTG